MRSDFTNTQMEKEEMGNCPNCQKQFVGAVEVSTTETGGTATIVLEETADRNWIMCDLCSLVVCKGCCADAQSGYCNACLREVQPTLTNEQPCPVLSRYGGTGGNN